MYPTRAFACRLLLLMLVMLLGSCAPRPALLSGPQTSEVSGAIAAIAPAGLRYQVDTELSDIRIVTYPEGLGHAHVIGGAALSGEIILPENHHQVWIDLAITVAKLQVDNSSWRVDENFDPDMSMRAIAGTRENMLTYVLQADKYPQILIRSDKAAGPLWQPDVTLQITLAGVTREMTVPVAVHLAGDSLEVTGRLQIRQSEFGIEPFSALGGVLRVADGVTVRFRILAHQGTQ